MHDSQTLLQALEDDMLAHHLAFAKLLGSTVHPEPDCLCYESKINFGAFGGILAQRFSEANVDQRIQKLNEIIRRSGKDYGWVLSPVATPANLEERLAAAGGKRLVELKGMALEMSTMAEPPKLEKISITLVEDEKALEQYARIYPLLYNIPIEGWIEELVAAEKLIFNSKSAAWNRWIAYENVKPIAAARTGQKDGIAALQILCTLPECRNRGIGQALASHALRHENCETVVVWSGPDADRLYSRMGFKQICRTAVYVF